MQKHSHVIGGSNAARIVNCPASVKAIEELPAVLRDEQPSIYATTGTACHTVISEMILNDAPMPEPGTVVSVPNETDITIDHDLLHDALGPAWDYYQDVLKRAGEGVEIYVEERVQFPGVEGGFGTLDLGIKAPAIRTTFLIDWKFGAGVPVQALYEDPRFPGELVVNEQLLFYATSAAHTLPDLFFPDGKIEIAIVQPRAQDESARITVVDDITAIDLKTFADVVASAIRIVDQDDAPRVRGHWCRFAPCKVTCPLHLNPMQGMSIEAVKRPAASQMAPAYVAAVLDAAPVVEGLIEAAREQARALIEAGTPVPGYKLVPKRAVRQWIPEPAELVKIFRKQLKLFKRDIYETPKLKSPAQIEKLIGKRKLPEGIAAGFSSGTTLAAETDHRPSVEPLDKLLAGLDTRALFDDK